MWKILNYTKTAEITCSRKPCFKPNTHRRRRRDETVESRRVGGVYWALVPIKAINVRRQHLLFKLNTGSVLLGHNVVYRAVVQT